MTKRSFYFKIMCLGLKHRRMNVYRRYRDLYRKEVGLHDTKTGRNPVA